MLHVRPNSFPSFLVFKPAAIAEHTFICFFFCFFYYLCQRSVVALPKPSTIFTSSCLAQQLFFSGFPLNSAFFVFFGDFHRFLLFLGNFSYFLDIYRIFSEFSLNFMFFDIF